MASEAQIAANRLNAQKSTGPRTPEGKAMMRRNPLRHGLSAATVVLFYESEAEFEQFRQDLAADFDPVGAEECALVEQIAILRWRLRRVGRQADVFVHVEGGDAAPIEPLVGDQAPQHVALAVRRREDDPHVMAPDPDLRAQEIRDIRRGRRPHLPPRGETADGEGVFFRFHDLRHGCSRWRQSR